MTIMPQKPERFQAAIDRSRKLGGVRTVRKIRENQYLVPSSKPGVNYVVGVMGSEIECSCQAGRRGIPCHHSASVYLAKMGESMGATIPQVSR